MFLVPVPTVLFIEFFQSFTGGGDLADVLTNVSGAGMGALLASVYIRFTRNCGTRPIPDQGEGTSE
jgi:glycopeptide antibiotics resistance protein